MGDDIGHGGGGEAGDVRRLAFLGGGDGGRGRRSERRGKEIESQLVNRPTELDRAFSL